MPDFSIRPDKTCLLIVDMTNGFLKAGARLEVEGGRDLVPRLKRLADEARKAGVLVVFLTMAFRPDRSDMGVHLAFRPDMAEKDVLIEGTDDVEFHEDLKPVLGDLVVVKRRFSAFIGTDLDLVLRGKGIDTVIIGGVATNICCESTARDARMLDYKVIVLSDGNAPMSLPDMGWGRISHSDVQRTVLTTMAFAFAQVSTVEEVAGRMAKARTD